MGFSSYTIDRRKSSIVTTENNISSKRVKHIIDKYLQERDFPNWYRGISKFQMRAANKLLESLRDDLEQETTHRVRYCLNLLGIHPMIKIREIKELMKLSRGSDIAFLWFLLELHYKTSETTEYTVNQQLIMSAIAHLDMVTTLRELDRILPRGHPPVKLIEKLQQRRLRQMEEAQRRKERLSKRRPKRNPKPLSPYFDKLVPRRHYGKSLKMQEPDFKVNLQNYRVFGDPNFKVPNESERWFVDYQLQPGKRIADRILREEVTNIFDPTTHEPVKFENTTRNLCKTHKALEDLEKSLELELKAIARERCLQYFDIDKHHREKTRKRITEQLEKDVEMHMCKFRQMVAKTSKSTVVQLIKKNSYGKFLAEADSGLGSFRAISTSSLLECEKGGEEKDAGICNKIKDGKIVIVSGKGDRNGDVVVKNIPTSENEGGTAKVKEDKMLIVCGKGSCDGNVVIRNVNTSENDSCADDIKEGKIVVVCEKGAPDGDGVVKNVSTSKNEMGAGDVKEGKMVIVYGKGARDVDFVVRNVTTSENDSWTDDIKEGEMVIVCGKDASKGDELLKNVCPSDNKIGAGGIKEGKLVVVCGKGNADGDVVVKNINTSNAESCADDIKEGEMVIVCRKGASNGDVVLKNLRTLDNKVRVGAIKAEKVVTVCPKEACGGDIVLKSRKTSENKIRASAIKEGKIVVTCGKGTSADDVVVQTASSLENKIYAGNIKEGKMVVISGREASDGDVVLKNVSTSSSEIKTGKEERNDQRKFSHSSFHGSGDCADNVYSKPDTRSLNNRCRCCDRLIGDGPSINVGDNKYMAGYDYGHTTDGTTPTLSQTYFKAPTEHKPYRFDYSKIYRPKEEKSLENVQRSLNVRICIAKALRKNQQQQQQQVDETSLRSDEDVRNCCKNIWREQMAQQKIKENEEERVRKSKPLPQYVDGAFYDPDNNDLMQQMLKDAFAYMQQNRTFVLATLPEAHKLPQMREWIMHRYGKRYTKEERDKAFSESIDTFNALIRTTMKVRSPIEKDIGKNNYNNYSCRDYILKRINDVKSKYYEELNASIMNQTRIFWFAMRPYLCSSGPPRNTFFAYMPSRVLELQYLRPWQSKDCINYKFYWEKRVAREQRKLYPY